MKQFQFIHELTYKDLPENVRRQATRLLTDVIAAGAGGFQTRLSKIIRDHAFMNFGGETAFLWLDGRKVSPVGAALANGMTVDALDVHDGHPITKGHAGAAVVPALTASWNLNAPVDGRELLTSLIVGYEIALRAGIALHQTALDYHTSGAWNTIGCAAVVSRRLGLPTEKTRHALGIAEYHGPRSQMMRCIDHPTMLKDGSGWGAMGGVSAGLLAAEGFTGAPAVTVEYDDAKDAWSDLGENWECMNQYIKPFAVCRWAQPTVEGVMTLKNKHGIDFRDVKRIKTETFHQAARLASRTPLSTEEAQYSLPFPAAVALKHGVITANELTGDALKDPEVLHFSESMEITESAEFNNAFPGKRFARVVLETTSGERFDSGPVEARWNAWDPPSDEEMKDKFFSICKGALSEEKTEKLYHALWSLSVHNDPDLFVDLLSGR